MQNFSSPRPSLAPLRLNNEARLYATEGTSFLAFDKPDLKERPVEYQSAHPGAMHVSDQGAALGNTFARPGVFAMRYGDSAAAAVNPGYDTDMRERAGAIRVKGPVSSAYERQGAAIDLRRFDPTHAYERYGLQQSAEWQRRSAGPVQPAGEALPVVKVPQVKGVEVTRMGEAESAGGQEAAAQAPPEARAICMPGFKLDKNGKCALIPEKQTGSPAASSSCTAVIVVVSVLAGLTLLVVLYRAFKTRSGGSEKALDRLSSPSAMRSARRSPSAMRSAKKKKKSKK